jgi:hypothetical protein
MDLRYNHLESHHGGFYNQTAWFYINLQGQNCVQKSKQENMMDLK